MFKSAMGNFHIFVAWRYIKTKKQDRFISLIVAFSLMGILLGVATLITVMSVMNGFREELLNRILGFNGHILLYKSSEQNIDNYQKLINDLSQEPLVKYIIPTIQSQGLVFSEGGASSGVLLKGYDFDSITKKKFLVENILFGNLEKIYKQNQVLIGESLAKKLQIMPGDQISVMKPEMKSTIFGSIPEIEYFIVGGIFKVGIIEFDSSSIILPLKLMQDVFDKKGSVTSLEVSLTRATFAEKFKNNIHSKLPPDIEVFDWKKHNSPVLNALEMERKVMFFILTLIIIVAAFNIISSLVMLVKDKAKDIGILKTLGASRMMIVKVFILVGTWIGFIGTFLGCCCGVLLSIYLKNIIYFIEQLFEIKIFDPQVYHLTTIPSILDYQQVLWIGTLSLGLSFLSTLYPAWRAASFHPIEVLRYE